MKYLGEIIFGVVFLCLIFGIEFLVWTIESILIIMGIILYSIWTFIYNFFHELNGGD